jgi:hypothetical protein
MSEKTVDEKVKEAVQKVVKPEALESSTWETGCKDCWYAREIQGAVLVVGEQQYECRRYPPSPFPIQQQTGGKTAMASLSIFPPVRAMGTVCGEWRAKGTRSGSGARNN